MDLYLFFPFCSTICSITAIVIDTIVTIIVTVIIIATIFLQYQHWCPLISIMYIT